MARKDTAADAANPGRLKQIALTYKMTRRADKKIGLVLAAVGIVTLGVFLAIGFWIGHPIYLGILGLLLAFLATAIVFGRRAERAAFGQMEGQPGAAAAALQMLRRGWKVDPVVAFTKQQDVVHRVVGPPGIVLVGEGTSPNRLRSLLVTERRKHERVAAGAPIHEVVCGNGEGQVPLTKLVRHVTKLGKGVKPAEMTDILARLKALDANRSNIPLPKGPMPTSMKGMRGNLRGR
jgi:uncharacterized protein DUF4191